LLACLAKFYQFQVRRELIAGKLQGLGVYLLIIDYLLLIIMGLLTVCIVQNN